MSEQITEKNKPNKILILIIIILAAACCVLGYLVYSGAFTSDKEEPVKEYTTELGEFTVNLADKSETYIKTTIALSYNDKAGNKVIENKLPQIRDCINKFFISKTSDSFKSDTIDATGQELIGKINQAIGSELIKNIYFEEIIIQ